MSVSTVLVRVRVDWAERAGIEREELLRGLPIDRALLAEVDGRVDLAAFAALQVRTMDLTRDEALGLHIAERATEGAFDLMAHRKAITGDRRSLPVRRLLLRNGRDLDPMLRRLLWTWLQEYPALRELYAAKESFVGFYRVRCYPQAARILTEITDRFALSQLPEIQTLRSTLRRARARATDRRSPRAPKERSARSAEAERRRGGARGGRRSEAKLPPRT